MGMSDCEYCWETPCVCGYDYRDMTQESLEKIAAVVLGELQRRGVPVPKPKEPFPGPRP
jgi:hypothetical protein